LAKTGFMDDLSQFVMVTRQAMGRYADDDLRTGIFAQSGHIVSQSPTKLSQKGGTGFTRRSRHRDIGLKVGREDSIGASFLL